MKRPSTSGLIIVATLLAGCAASERAKSRLDSSGLTVVTHSDAVLLARPVRTLASGARDYATIGPVEINRMGRLEHYLWIALASTIDRDLAGLEPPTPSTVLLIVDGDAMVLPVSRWPHDLDVAPYVTHAPVYATLAAPASLDQIHRIAGADSVELQLILPSQQSAVYRAWEGSWQAWTRFPEE